MNELDRGWLRTTGKERMRLEKDLRNSRFYHCGIYHFNKTTSEQNPGPMAASTLHVPAGGR